MEAQLKRGSLSSSGGTTVTLSSFKASFRTKLPLIQDSRMVCTIQGPGNDDNNYDDDTNDDDDGRPVFWHPVHHGRWPTQFS